MLTGTRLRFMWTAFVLVFLLAVCVPLPQPLFARTADTAQIVRTSSQVLSAPAAANESAAAKERLSRQESRPAAGRSVFADDSLEIVQREVYSTSHESQQAVSRASAEHATSTDSLSKGQQVVGINLGLAKSGTSSLWQTLKTIPELEKKVSLAQEKLK